MRTTFSIAFVVSGFLAVPALALILATGFHGDASVAIGQHFRAGRVTIAKGGALEACSSEIGKYCIGKEGGAKKCLSEIPDKTSGECKAALGAPAKVAAEKNPVPRCAHSPLCSTTIGGGKPTVDRVLWNQAGYTFAYPFALPAGATGGVSGVAVDSHDNLWAFERNPSGTPQLFEFDAHHKLIRTVGADVINYIFKAHGIAVDAQGQCLGSATPTVRWCWNCRRKAS